MNDLLVRRWLCLWWNYSIRSAGVCFTLIMSQIEYLVNKFFRHIFQHVLLVFTSLPAYHLLVSLRENARTQNSLMIRSPIGIKPSVYIITLLT
jgi:hypothetical protein